MKLLTGNDLETGILDPSRQRRRIRHDLLRVGAKFWLQRLLESHRFRCDHVHQRATL